MLNNFYSNNKSNSGLEAKATTLEYSRLTARVVPRFTAITAITKGA